MAQRIDPDEDEDKTKFDNFKKSRIIFFCNKQGGYFENYEKVLGDEDGVKEDGLMNITKKNNENCDEKIDYRYSRNLKNIDQDYERSIISNSHRKKGKLESLDYKKKCYSLVKHKKIKNEVVGCFRVDKSLQNKEFIQKSLLQNRVNKENLLKYKGDEGNSLKKRAKKENLLKNSAKRENLFENEIVVEKFIDDDCVIQDSCGKHEKLTGEAYYTHLFCDILKNKFKNQKFSQSFSLYSNKRPSLIIRLIILAILFDVTTILASRLQDNQIQITGSVNNGYNTSSKNEVTVRKSPVTDRNRLKNGNDVSRYLLLLEQNASFTDDLEESAKNNSYLDSNSSLFGAVSNVTDEEPLSDFIFMGVTSVVLGIMILITVIGNVFVIAAILLERNLQNVANYLIVSLAVADLMVACLVMPLGAVYEISRGWILGPELCDMWTSSDVLCCTASILHLVAIAVDRYWAVTNVDYIHTRNGSRIVTMIVVVWSVALVVSLAPQFGWKDPDYLDRINLQQRCLVSQDIGYQIFATCSTFYVPLLVILVLYWKIFQTARKRIRRRRAQRNAVLETNKSVTKTNDDGGGPTKGRGKRTLHFITKRRFLRSSRSKSDNQQASLALVEGQSSTEVLAEEEAQVSSEDQATAVESGTAAAITTAFTISSPNTDTAAANHRTMTDEEGKQIAITENQVINNNEGLKESPPQAPATVIMTTTLTPAVTSLSHAHNPPPPPPSPSPLPAHHAPNKRDLKKESLEAKRERKAAKTLAIITGAFVVCWLPFFIMALLMPLCESCTINNYVASFFLWLGYFNSTLNPVIYTIFSPEFRQAFKRMLCGVSNGRNRGNRKLR